MGSSDRKHNDEFQWTVDDKGNRWVEPTQNNVSISHGISGDDKEPFSLSASSAYGPGIGRKLLRSLIAGYGHADNMVGQFFIENRLISSYRHAIRTIYDHMAYDSDPIDVGHFQTLLTPPIINRAQKMYLPRVVVVPPVSARQIMQAYKMKHKDIEVWQKKEKGNFVSNPEKRAKRLSSGRKLIKHFPWEEYERVWNDGEKEQDPKWEIWLTDGEVHRVVVDDPSAMSRAIQRVSEKQLRPFGGLRRALSLYIGLPTDLSFLEFTGRDYFKVCINPNSAVQNHTGTHFAALLMGYRSKADDIKIYIDSNIIWLSLLAGIRIC